MWLLMKVREFLKSRLCGWFPGRQLKVNLLYSFTFQCMFQRNQGIINQGSIFLLCVCINVEENASSVLHLPHCSDCTLWTPRGGCSTGFSLYAFSHAVISYTFQTYFAAQQLCQTQHSTVTSLLVFKTVIYRTKTGKFMSESHDIFCNHYIHCRFMCICVYMYASTNWCTCIQTQAKHECRQTFR